MTEEVRDTLIKWTAISKEVSGYCLMETDKQYYVTAAVAEELEGRGLAVEVVEVGGTD